ncbi:MAG: nucleotidyltransferase domain-containing protein [Methylococcales bacterium]|nr:nucleotidyltransferase domain-containing protein [Methylococcales bacterium]
MINLRNNNEKATSIRYFNPIKPGLIKRFGITRLALFGSTERDEAREDSDIDIIVSFNEPAMSKQYFSVQFFLEDWIVIMSQ